MPIVVRCNVSLELEDDTTCICDTREKEIEHQSRQPKLSYFELRIGGLQDLPKRGVKEAHSGGASRGQSSEISKQSPSSSLQALAVMRCSSRSAVFLLTSFTCISEAALLRRQNCGMDYTTCAPEGATRTNSPSVGTGLAPLYRNLLDSIKGIQGFKREVNVENELMRRESLSMCCKSSTPTIYHAPYISDRADFFNFTLTSHPARHE